MGLVSFMNIEGLYINTKYNENGQQVTIYLFVYADNIVIASRNPTLVFKIKNYLHKKYIIKDLGRISRFLRI